MYILKREIVVSTTHEKAWRFISRPENLNLITPEDLSFQIVSEVPEDMHNGLLVEYLVTIPVIGKQRWLSEIKHVRDHHSFVDEQRVGPYKLWYHYHKIEAVPDGVLFTDEVTYEPPFSIFGRMANSLFIRKTLNRIFDYRTERFAELLTESTDVARANNLHELKV